MFVLIFPSVNYAHGSYNIINIIVDSEQDPTKKLPYVFIGNNDLLLENATLDTVEKKLRMTLNNSTE